MIPRLIDRVVRSTTSPFSHGPQPLELAGVEQHSRYRTDPLGRLSRTSVYVTETTDGAIPRAKAAVAA
ncbi:MAG: DUF2236 domain-containing protein [Actinomycetia bacterium]|nr:DUF2236 domain-containing protein [Actinomycetes bacterium]